MNKSLIKQQGGNNCVFNDKTNRCSVRKDGKSNDPLCQFNQDTNRCKKVQLKSPETSIVEETKVEKVATKSPTKSSPKLVTESNIFIPKSERIMILKANKSGEKDEPTLDEIRKCTSRIDLSRDIREESPTPKAPTPKAPTPKAPTPKAPTPKAATPNIEKSVVSQIKDGKCTSGNNGKIVFTGNVLLAKEYNKKDGSPTVNPVGWWASEKFDGYRSIWNGKSFVSRSGKPFMVPEWFSALMPPGIALDGEFWLGRACFEQCGIFRRLVPDEEEWINLDVKYKVFDIPSLNKPFEERMEFLKKLIEERCNCMIQINVPGRIVNFKCPLQLTEQIKVSSEKQLQNLFATTIKNQGEGIMLRQAGSFYEQKRSSTLLKMKAVFDTEGKIIGYKPGTGKYSGMLGSFKCEVLKGKHAGKIFNASGMNDEIRANYKITHPIGTIITVTFNDYTKDGVPRHPRYLRKRSDHGL